MAAIVSLTFFAIVFGVQVQAQTLSRVELQSGKERITKMNCNQQGKASVETQSVYYPEEQARLGKFDIETKSSLQVCRELRLIEARWHPLRVDTSQPGVGAVLKIGNKTIPGGSKYYSIASRILSDTLNRKNVVGFSGLELDPAKMNLIEFRKGKIFKKSNLSHKTCQKIGIYLKCDFGDRGQITARQSRTYQ